MSRKESVESIAVVGLGYVGLPLALLAAKKGLSVYGVDVDKKKLSNLEARKSYIDDISDEELADTSAVFTDDASIVSTVSSVIVCVPTPVTADKQPDLTPVRSAVSSIAKHLKPGTLVIIESTVNPGVCEGVVAPLIEEISGLTVDKDILLAHCPERINPGDPHWNVSNINRVVGANTKESLDRAVSLYEQILDAAIKPMASIKEAEAVKVVENSFRDINIAFVNELAMSFDKLGIDVVNVIDGAATKPFAFMPHYPGCGVGGHCIPVDPYYLIEYASSFGFEHDFLRLARSINEGMPEFAINLLTRELNKVGRAVNNTRIALLGLSYKANIGDDRESPSYEIKKLLEENEADYIVYDPYLPEKSSVSSLKNALTGCSAIIVASAHDEFKKLTPSSLKEHGVEVVIDGRNLLRIHKQDFEKQGIRYVGIGA